MKIKQTTLLTICVLIFLGCGVNNSDEVERTYPESFDYETVTIQQLLGDAETPDSVNIDVFVFDMRQCPEGAMCFAPDGIFVSEKLPPADTLFITAREPKQFQKQERYQISLYVDKEDTQDYPFLRLLGYSLVE